MHRLQAVALAGLLMVTSGCAITLAKRSPWDVQQLQELSDQLEQFKTLARLKEEELEQLRRAKAMMETRVGSDADVGYDERGVVTRLLDQVLFDSGKAKLRRGATRVLDKVADVLQEFPNQPIGIEGHTDNEPIKYSGWADNTALSLARAQAVADYLTTQQGVDPSRIVVNGYGEERPIASNDEPTGRQQNRRVEIVILPSTSARSSYRK